MTFKNAAKSIDPKERNPWITDVRGAYTYDKPSPYLHVWSRLFQCVISIAATRMFTKKWHTGSFAIYKCEGGCSIPGVNDLVLNNESCYFDYGGKSNKDKEDRCAKLISAVVLEWNPNDPTQSMFRSAADFIGEKLSDFEEAVGAAYGKSNPFGGDALSRFFDYNPFSKFPDDRDYMRFCLVDTGEHTNEQVDQRFADEDMGDDLLGRMIAKLREQATPGSYVSMPLCCSPNRSDKGVKFWINTGGNERINGWKTAEEIETYILDPKEFNAEKVKAK